MAALALKVRSLMADDEGDLSTYIAQGIMALAAISLTGVVLFAFGAVGTRLKEIVDAWITIPISTGQ